MKKSITLFCVLAMMVGRMTAAEGASVNIDFEGGSADTTYVGANGIYSSTGTAWTSVLPNVNASNLPNEFGAPTEVDVVFTDSSQNTFGFVDLLSTNRLQDSGIQTTGLQIVGLSPTKTYDIAGYIQESGGFNVTDATGTLGFVGFGEPTYALPGIETIGGAGGQRGDYILFNDVVPVDLGGGNFGFTINTDGAITGLQIIDIDAVPEPSTALLALLMGLIGIANRLVGRQ